MTCNNVFPDPPPDPLERNPISGGGTVDLNLRLLATRLLYVLAGKASVTFPSSTRAAPSIKVFVDLLNTSMFREGDRALFSFTVGWKTWEIGIKPVLQDEALQLRVANNRERLHLQHYEEMIEHIQALLEIQFRAVGLLPPTP